MDMFTRHRAHGFGLEDTRPWGDVVVTGHGKVLVFLSRHFHGLLRAVLMRTYRGRPEPKSRA
jgi:hypothetical protein